MKEFNLDDLEPVNIQIDEVAPTTTTTNETSITSGIELLMNTKKISNSSKRNLHLGEVGEIEDEINKLYSNNKKVETTNTLSGFANNLFNLSSNNDEEKKKNIDIDSNLGSPTANCVSGISKSKDGFSKINDIPAEFSGYNKLSEREKKSKKRKMLRDLNKNGNRNPTHCNEDTPYDEVEDEYNVHIEDNRRQSSVKVQKMWFMTIVNSIEALNGWYDPFNMSLDGWSEAINDDIESYDDIFAELYDKYRGVKISPELSLLGRIGFSAGITIFMNRQLSASSSDFSEVVKQSPTLMKEYTKTATKIVNDSNPIFNMFSSQSNESSYGPPPRPVETKLPPPSERMMPKNSSRPDIAVSRGSMFREDGIDMVNDRLNIQQENTFSIPSNQRYEMKGPKDINVNDFLPNVNIKTKVNVLEENDSMISATSMREMMMNNKPSKKTNRRKLSEKNTISLDI